MAYANNINISFKFKPVKGREKKMSRVFGFTWKSSNYLVGGIFEGEEETCIVRYSKKFQAPIVINKKHHKVLTLEEYPQLSELFGAIMATISVREPEAYELV